ncbi:SpaA isopeptide-forming pilin-related protein [uncultured Merdimonas sp.]|uniref:SpaA isopeptide-forming pilin-related protein n=1 Tax=uncultured Merdimonas sp. TaxID=2023269 RepID=UPI003208701C
MKQIKHRLRKIIALSLAVMFVASSAVISGGTEAYAADVGQSVVGTADGQDATSQKEDPPEQAEEPETDGAEVQEKEPGSQKKDPASQMEEKQEDKTADPKGTEGDESQTQAEKQKADKDAPRQTQAEPEKKCTDPGEAEYFDRYDFHAGSSGSIRLMSADETVTDLSADIRKRTQWTDEETGDGKVTLQYRSNSGTVQGTEDMNVVLIQDKSGSMDANYGYNLERVRQGWGNPVSTKWYPIQNEYGWTETLSDMAAEQNYYYRVNHKDAASGYEGWMSGWLHNGEMPYNSPCQEPDHYYLLFEEDPTSGLPAWTMAHGNNLYNILHTDLHHYVKLDSREEALGYLEQGRRVVRLTGGSYYNESGMVPVRETIYFLDVSQIVNHGSGWILNTCAPEECQTSDRLAKSQEFFSTLVDKIRDLNSDNKIAYIPFWGDVPKNGSWSNAHANGTADGLYTDNTGRMTHMDGATWMGFTNDFEAIKQEGIDHAFTYDGTNWSRAFQAAIDLLNGRSTEDKKKDTLIIFLTDGMPQGTVGTSLDMDNPKINGARESAQLKAMDGVTIYACGVAMNEQDQTGAAQRVSQVDSTGYGTFARHNSEFAEMEAKILKRIDEQYVIPIKGKDAFYTDTMNGPFTVDVEKLGKEWKVLENPGSGTTKGVPTAVYEAARDGASYVYVKSTRTVYWSIGELTDGGYTDPGHEMSFPIQYADYEMSTDGKDKSLKSNTVQKLTYVTTRDPGSIKTVEMDTPSIIFNRQAKPGITVTKTVSGSSFTEDQTFRFVYSDKKLSGDPLSGYLGDVEVTVKAGEASGKGEIQSLDPGTYYLYEVDEKGHRISAQEGKVTVTEEAKITTEAVSSTVPHSAQSSDAEELENLDNVLTITTKGGTAAFTNEYVKVAVEKIWEDGDYEGRPEEVTVELLRNGKSCREMKLTARDGWKGAFENLEKYDPEGKTYEYTIREQETVGYESKVEQTRDGFWTIRNKIVPNSIKIRKLDTDGKTPLSGAVFEIKDEDGKVIDTQTSGDNGEAVFENLYPGTYTITETSTVPGHTLLKDPLKVTVPIQMSAEEAEDKGVDKDQCLYYPEANVYLLNNLVYEVTNHSNFVLPVTGGHTGVGVYLPLLLGIIILIIAYVVYRKKQINV